MGLKKVYWVLHNSKQNFDWLLALQCIAESQSKSMTDFSVTYQKNQNKPKTMCEVDVNRANCQNSTLVQSSFNQWRIQLTENLWLAVTASIFMPRPPTELKLITNFNAVSKNVKIVQIEWVEPKLRNNREIPLENHKIPIGQYMSGEAETKLKLVVAET